jgi:hypothetical protein
MFLLFCGCIFQPALSWAIKYQKIALAKQPGFAHREVSKTDNTSRHRVFEKNIFIYIFRFSKASVIIIQRKKRFCLQEENYLKALLSFLSSGMS